MVVIARRCVASLTAAVQGTRRTFAGSNLAGGASSKDYQISGHLRCITAASSREIARYIHDETISRTPIAVITMFILNIWLPYWMMYPSPRFADWNSPTTTPTRDKPAFTFRAASSGGTLPGSTTFARVVGLFSRKAG